MANSKAARSELHKDKKGFSVTFKLLMWVPRFLFTVVVIGITFYVILSFIVNKTNVSDVESKILMNSPYFSPNGFSVNDEKIGRVYPGVVDMARFTDDSQLQKLFQHYRPIIVGRYVLRQTAIDRQLNPKEDVPIYTDKARYEQWQPIAQVEGKGVGGKSSESEVRYAAANDGTGRMVEAVFISSN